MRRSRCLPSLFVIVALLCGCRCGVDPDPVATWQWATEASLGEHGQSLARLRDRVVVVVDGGLQSSDDGGATFGALEATGLPAGAVNVVHLLEDPAGGEPVLMASVFGAGLYRSVDGGATFAPVTGAPSADLMQIFNPRARVLPFDFAGDAVDGWLAGLGGLFFSEDGGDRWGGVDLFDTGSLNVLFTGVAVSGLTVAGVSMLADAILPADQQGVLTGVLFLSEDGGESWIDASTGAPFEAPTGVAFDGDAIVVSAMDGGLFRLADGVWTALGGPSDGVAVAVNEAGIDVASATRGLWRYADGTWTHGGSGAISALSGDLALGHDGTLYRLTEGEGDPPPEPAGGTVHIALSFHVNLYHSYRGDSLDDDGFGMDLRVMRGILDWLDEYPRVHGDWDMDNAFSVDGWLPEHGPDILARIRERVQDGMDDVRLMSWNNGAMAAKTREEFDAAIEWAKQSNAAAFGRYVPGVQPQECMITPEQFAWYRELGIEWITLFNSASPFTALRPEVSITGPALYNASRLVGPREEDGEMVLVPVYHQADVLSHGGLAAWVRQIADTHSGDSLLVIHMDADAEVWEAFDAAIDDVYDLDYVRFTTIQGYLDDHAIVDEIVLHGDLSDGVDDGFQSWAEKNVNFEFFTEVARARADVDLARALGGGDADVDALVLAALEPRLLSLSTTHYGLASPNLHPDREVSARAHLADARAAAGAALDAALATVTVPAGEIRVVNTRPSAGTARVEIPGLVVDEGDWDGPAGLVIRDAAGVEIPAALSLLDDAPVGEVVVTASVILEMAAFETRTLHWTYDPDAPSSAGGAVDADRLDDADLVSAPFTECRGQQAEGTLDDAGAVSVDARGVRASRMATYGQRLCSADGTMVRTATVYDGLPGVVVEIDATLGMPSQPQSAESVALTPVACPGGEAAEVTWQTFGGTVRSRPVRRDVRVWNGQAVDGWLALHCADGAIRQVAHHVATRTSMASYPLRHIDGTALLAPLGTLWGEPAWHDARSSGGHGIGDAAVSVVGAQFRPSAPDWSGQSMRYRLLVGDGAIDPGTLDLFAHPPAVIVGE